MPLRKSTLSGVPASMLPTPSQANAVAALPSHTSTRTRVPLCALTSQVRSCIASFAGAVVWCRIVPFRASTSAM